MKFLFSAVVHFVRTRPTFLKPIYVVTNVDGAGSRRLLPLLALCWSSLLLDPLLIDITQNNLTMKLAVAALCATSAAAFAPSQVPAAVSAPVASVSRFGFCLCLSARLLPLPPAFLMVSFSRSLRIEDN